MRNKNNINNCRVCGHVFFDKPLLQYANMPKAAQFFPDKESLKQEKGINLKIYQCSGCGLVQMGSKPVPYYKDVVRAVSISSEIKEFRAKQFKNFVNKYSLRAKKILEIGCGRGEHLFIMRKLVKKTYGIENSKESVNYCVKQGLNVSKEFLAKPSQKLLNAPFDAFFIMNFLEHLPFPNETLTGMYNNLSGEGLGLVEVPNFDMILRNNLFSEFIPDHLLYFTQDTLIQALSLNGFDVIECSEERYDYIISATVRKRKKLDLSSFYIHQERLKKDLNSYINRFGNKKIAIWGAGHQALAVIAMTGIAKKIKYVVDSAPFKQNKYTPATHLPVVAPEKLLTDKVDAVIVMAAGYSNEVAEIIKRKYNNIKIAVLRDFGLEIIHK
jgi:SAM-dependent methyltransferase